MISSFYNLITVEGSLPFFYYYYTAISKNTQMFDRVS